MDIKHTISASKARQNLAEVIEQVDKTGARYTLTVNGTPKVVLINAEELESLQETLDILSDPKILSRIRKAEKELADGKSLNIDELLSDVSPT